MYNYAIQPHDNGMWATCRDLPELHIAGDDRDDTLANAADGLVSALSIYVDQRRAIPQATAPQEGEQVVYLPALVSAKIELWNATVEKGMRKADLPRKLDAKPVAINRLLDFEHSSKLEHVERALAALGKRLSIEAEPA